MFKRYTTDYIYLCLIHLFFGIIFIPSFYQNYICPSIADVIYQKYKNVNAGIGIDIAHMFKRLCFHFIHYWKFNDRIWGAYSFVFSLLVFQRPLRQSNIYTMINRKCEWVAIHSSYPLHCGKNIYWYDNAWFDLIWKETKL